MNVVQTLTNNGTSSTVSVTITPGANSSLVVFVGVRAGSSSNTTSLSDNLGTVYTKHQELRNSLNATLAAYSGKPNGTVTLTATYGLSGKEMQLIVVEVSGLGAFDAVGGDTSSSTTPSITTTKGGIVLGTFFVADANNAHTFTAGTGYTVAATRYDAAMYSLAEYQMTGAAGTYNATATMGGSTGLTYPVNCIIGFQTGSTAYTVSLSDSIASGDSLTKQASRRLNDTTTLTDTVVKAFSDRLSDSMSLTDTESERASKAFSDAISVLDSISQMSGTQKTASLSDGITISDTLTKRLTWGRQLFDSVAVTDSLFKKKSKTLNDSVTASDTAISKQVKALKQDIISFTENKIARINRVIGDVLFTTDSARIMIDPLVGTIPLDGEFSLYVYLLGEGDSLIQIDCFTEGGPNLTATHQNFSMYQGESKNLLITIYGENLSLTGSVITWSLKDKVTKTTDNGITILNETQFQVSITPEDTRNLSPATYPHQAYMVDTRDNETVLFVGDIEVLKR